MAELCIDILKGIEAGHINHLFTPSTQLAGTNIYIFILL